MDILANVLKCSYISVEVQGSVRVLIYSKYLLISQTMNELTK